MVSADAEEDAIKIMAVPSPPFVMPDGSGLWAELANCAAKPVKMTVTINATPGRRAVRAVLRGETDAYMPGVSMFPKDKKDKLAGVQLMNIPLVLVYSKTRTPELAGFHKDYDLTGYRVGLLDNAASRARYIAAGAQVFEFPTPAMKVRNLIAGRVDMLVNTVLGLSYLLNYHPDKAQMAITAPIKWAPISMAFNRDNPTTESRIKRLAQGLRACQINGQYHKILAKYYGPGNVPLHVALGDAQSGVTTKTPSYDRIIFGD